MEAASLFREVFKFGVAITGSRNLNLKVTIKEKSLLGIDWGLMQSLTSAHGAG
jgi:hypothetical protein